MPVRMASPSNAFQQDYVHEKIIRSTKAIAAQCKSLHTGELVHLSGLLVEATGDDAGTWRSSLSRTDSGNGACELVWVEELHQIPR